LFGVRESTSNFAARIQYPEAIVMILFVPSTRYHVQTFAPVCSHLKVPFVFSDSSKYKPEGATEEALRLGLPVVRNRLPLLTKTRPTVAVFMNDWGPFERPMVRQAKKLGIVTLGLVEGAQDYEDTHLEHVGQGHRRFPYQTVDVPLLMGSFDKIYVPNPRAVITGCPRIDSLLKKKCDPPTPPTVLVNSNFTYQLYEHVRRSWIRDVVDACRAIGLRYMISVHHADHGEFSPCERTALPLYDAICQSNVLVSRFSTAILEAMVLGRQVVYYNPHGEYQTTFRDPMGAFPVAKNRDELIEAIKLVLDDPERFARGRKKFMALHLGYLDGGSSQRTAETIEYYATRRRRMPIYRIPLHAIVLLQQRFNLGE